MIKRVIITVLDGFGVGEMPDAKKYGETGVGTFKHIYESQKPNLPILKKLGLFNIDDLNWGDSGIVEKSENLIGNYGRAKEESEGMNSPVGHWEMSGFVLRKPFKTFPNAFPEKLINEFKEKTGVKGILCNEVGSGTELLKKYGEEQVKTGYPIIYTSADSVFQIAAHEDVVPLKELYRWCEVARKILDRPEYNVGTVIARPFVGTNAENFKRTYNRKDFDMSGFGKTMVDVIAENNEKVVAIGKVNDIFSGRGISKAIHTEGNKDGMNKTIEEVKNDNEAKLIFTNLVDTDMLYGHRNNVEGYAKALEEYDSQLQELINSMQETDMLIVTADHGNDPTTPKTDHTREYTPVLVYGKELKKGVNLGTRQTFADISATILDLFGYQSLPDGTSFKKEIVKRS